MADAPNDDEATQEIRLWPMPSDTREFERQQEVFGLGFKLLEDAGDEGKTEIDL
jgi:hypothetical protein